MAMNEADRFMARLLDQCVAALLLQPGPALDRLQRAIEERPDSLWVSRDDATGNITLHVLDEAVYRTHVSTLRDPASVQ
jgi:hypothetical protein